MSINQRKEARHPLNLDAFFMSAQLPPQICKIRDFCNGGMYLSYSNRVLRFKRGEQLTVNFNLQIDDLMQACQLHGYVAHCVEGGMGVAFTQQPTEELLTALQAESNRVGVSTRTQPIKPEAVQWVRHCRDLCLNCTTQMTKDLLNLTRQQLLLAAGQTQNIEDKKEYNETANFLQQNPNRITENFVRKIGKTIDSWIDSIPGSDDLAGVLPTFIDAEEDFEEWLAIKVIVSKVETEFLEALYSIQMRLNFILKSSKMGGHNNPFGPYVICHAFKDVFDPFGIKPKSEKIIYRVLSEVMVKHMKSFYDEVNQFFIKENVLPKLTFRDPLRSLVAQPIDQSNPE